MESPVVRRLRAIDWDFPLTRSESPFSTLHWHPCRFPSQVAAAAVGLLSPPGGLVLDPFSGSGTTAVEAQILGRRSVGVDVSPISCLITRAKTLSLGAVEIGEIAVELKRLAANAVMSGRLGSVPPSVQSEKWYSKVTFSKLAAIFGSLEGLSGQARDIGLACFSATLLPACNEDRHWGYVCDNTNPKAQRIVDALRLYNDNLDSLVSAYISRDEVLSRRTGGGEPQKCEVIHGNINAIEHKLIELGPVDCIVTSPPYFGVADYVKSQRLTLEWLAEEIEPLRKQEIGARSKRHRATAREDYVNEITEAFRVSSQPLKAGGYCLIVYGESSSRPTCLPDILSNLDGIGLKKIAVVERSVSISRRQKPSVLLEYVILTQK